MKTITTILAIMTTSVFFAQVEPSMVIVPNYTDTIEFQETTPVLNTYRRRSNNYFIIGNFNNINITRNQLEIPETTVDNNNPEYIKTTKFRPEKTLSEILREDN